MLNILLVTESLCKLEFAVVSERQRLDFYCQELKLKFFPVHTYAGHLKQLYFVATAAHNSEIPYFLE